MVSNFRIRKNFGSKIILLILVEKIGIHQKKLCFIFCSEKITCIFFSFHISVLSLKISFESFLPVIYWLGQSWTSFLNLFGSNLSNSEGAFAQVSSRRCQVSVCVCVCLKAVICVPKRGVFWQMNAKKENKCPLIVKLSMLRLLHSK